jgi:AraC-like DNA-binding protein
MSEQKRDIDWDAVRADYESGSSFNVLADRYHVSKTYIIERRNKGNWNRPTTDRPPNTQGIPNRDVNATMRVAEAIKLRVKKFTYQEIADQCGYSDASACHHAVQRELQRIVVENIEELRREESIIYDRLHAECWELAIDKGNKGRLFAVDRLISISERRAKLMGLDVRPDEVLAGVTIIREYGVEVAKV